MPITAGAIVRQGINVAETVVAAFLPPGSVTIISYANRLTFVISSVFLTSVTTASTPAMSQAMSLGRKTQVRSLLISALRLTAFVALPLGLAMAALGVPVIRMLFERGRFTPEASQLTGVVLSFYAISIIFLGYARVVQAYFYAALRTRCGAGAVHRAGGGKHRSGSCCWRRDWACRGSAIGFSVGAIVSTALGLWWLWRDRGEWSDLTNEVEQRQVHRQVRELLLLNGKAVVASLAMAVAAVVTMQLLPDRAWALLPAMVVGGAVFLLVASAAARQGAVAGARCRDRARAPPRPLTWSVLVLVLILVLFPGVVDGRAESSTSRSARTSTSRRTRVAMRRMLSWGLILLTCWLLLPATVARAQPATPPDPRFGIVERPPTRGGCGGRRGLHARHPALGRDPAGRTGGLETRQRARSDRRRRSWRPGVRWSVC